MSARRAEGRRVEKGNEKQVDVTAELEAMQGIFSFGAVGKCRRGGKGA